MRSFLNKFAGVVRGVLCGFDRGFDRLFLRGTLRAIARTEGVRNFLWYKGVLLKEFGDYSQQVTAQLIEASLRQAQQLGREIRDLNSADFRKEDIAREIAARDHIKEGLICVLKSVDPCMSFQSVKNHLTKKLEIRYRPRKCLHLYHYTGSWTWLTARRSVRRPMSVTWRPWPRSISRPLCVNSQAPRAFPSTLSGTKYQINALHCACNEYTPPSSSAMHVYARLNKKTQLTWLLLTGGPGRIARAKPRPSGRALQ
jgi:hypothetical protein